MQVVSAIVGMASFFCFLYFIKKVALFIDRRDQAQYAGKVITVLGFLVFLYVVMAFGMIAMFIGMAGGGGNQALAGLGIAAGCFGLFILLNALVLLIMYTTLLRNMIAAIKQRMQIGPARY